MTNKKDEMEDYFFNSFSFLILFSKNLHRDGTNFGHYPKDSVFIVQVTLNINATAPTAHIVLAGAGASGITDYNILSPFIAQAQSFGAVRLWMGFPWVGSFDATQILVTRRNN